MKIGLQGPLGHCLAGQAVALIETAREVGADGLELAEDRRVPTEAIPAIRRRIEDAGLEVASFQIACRFSTTRGSREAESPRGEVRRALERAARLGASTALLHADRPPARIPVEHERSAFADGILGVMPDLLRLGLQPTFSNSGVHARYYGQSDHLLQLCRDFAPHAAVTFDPANSLLAGEAILEAIDRLAPWLAVVHLKDWTILPGGRVSSWSRRSIQYLAHRVLESRAVKPARFLGRPLGLAPLVPRAVRGLDGRWYAGAAIGEGILDHAPLLSRLRLKGFSGYLSVEYEGSGDATDALRRGVRHVRRILAERAL